MKILTNIYCNVLFLGIFTCLPLFGQPELDQKFWFEAFKSLRSTERFRSSLSRVDNFATYFTFHPVSKSNGIVSMYLTSTFTDENGNMVVELGRIIELPETLLPAEPIQLIIQPTVIYINSDSLFRNEMNFIDRFPESELERWKACGYNIKKPEQIIRSTQH
ncbi:hypothetical protein SAMN05444359_11484 [Neolewinella agarilytica]|uniref:Uncharacterized protein n=1 Tax=Neolewinella agarilytica TaxID=478744 RepID=A0A1H9I8G6_9BACT|nr:hypothetical protein SAMN05444359_11484 [Neolewinella agarilytica]